MEESSLKPVQLETTSAVVTCTTTTTELGISTTMTLELQQIIDEKDRLIKRQIAEIQELRKQAQALSQEKISLLCEVSKLKFELEMSGLQYIADTSASPQSKIVDRSSVSASNVHVGSTSPRLRQLKSYSADSHDPSSQHANGSAVCPQSLLQRHRQRSLGSSGGNCRRVTCRTAEDIIKCSRTPTFYELSQDILDKQVEVLERKYGGQTRASHAALTIQRAFRKYCMVKKFHDITSAKSEKRLSRRFTGSDVVSTSSAAGAMIGHMAPTTHENASHTQAQLQHNFAALYRELSETLEPNENGRPPRPVRSLSLREKRQIPVLQSSSSSSSSSEHAQQCLRRTTDMDYVASGAHHFESEYSDAGGFEDVGGTVSRHRSNVQQTYAQVHVNSAGTPSDVLYLPFDADVVCNDVRCEPNVVVGRRLAATCCGRMVAADAPSRRNSAPQPELKKKVPPEVPKRTSSITSSRNIDGTKGIVSNGDLMRSPDGGSLSSVQSSGSESSLTGSSSDRATSSRHDDTLNISVVQHEHHLPLPYIEDKRLSNISENSEDSFEGTGYSSSPPVSEGTFRHPLHHGACDTPLPTPPGYYKVSELVRKRQYRVGLNLFNKKPEKGIYYLIQRAFLENAPQAVARFLISRKGLSKQMIGEYLGNLQNSFNMDVLECFAGEIDLAGMQVDVALRKFQTCFRMPGEAQKIERLVEVFSSRYCECNRDIVSRFNNPDTVFILAFAIIMLNTDLHTPNMKPEKRMKPEEFVRNLRGIDDGADVDDNMLLGIYERIKMNEFRPGSDHVTQVMKVQQTIVGKKPTLALPHRRLVCYCRLYEVNDINKKERQGVHQREVFLFNDLLVVTKILSKKKNGVTYTFRQSFPLCGLQVSLFEVVYYPHGIQLAQKVDGKVAITFNARNEHDRTKFVEDMKESILEMDEMENLRIESELEKQQKLARSRAAENRDSGVADMECPSVMVVVNGVDGNKVSIPNGNGTVGGGLKRSALSNSLLDIHEQMEKPQRRGSAGSLDSGMSVSFQSSAASLGSRDSSPHQAMLSNGKVVSCVGNGKAGSASSNANQTFFGGLFGKKGRNQSKTSIKTMGNSTDLTEV